MTGAARISPEVPVWTLQAVPARDGVDVGDDPAWSSLRVPIGGECDADVCAPPRGFGQRRGDELGHVAVPGPGMAPYGRTG